MSLYGNILKWKVHHVYKMHHNICQTMCPLLKQKIWTSLFYLLWRWISKPIFCFHMWIVRWFFWFLFFPKYIFNSMKITISTFLQRCYCFLSAGDIFFCCLQKHLEYTVKKSSKTIINQKYFIWIDLFLDTPHHNRTWKHLQHSNQNHLDNLLTVVGGLNTSSHTHVKKLKGRQINWLRNLLHLSSS